MYNIIFFKHSLPAIFGLL